ncbi:homocysteine S-methyltransferase family protein [Helicobacter turcicus]|uniref:Methionine synthase n=1 Tax=Helicobacter turcicus TaxID=2867412 RepID=A0ABS7JKI7_9HELI|nr:homocysteine S-methyltransferase family protein [Helicobacter turcicus]MBX7489896.1 homocysteine S-methyltransferase family protein [Helicobacter turcicus]MBX7544756.1 homocysteine S-methyltransferase family protein [Helicobacter turcicus]
MVTQNQLESLLKEQVLILDGAMGTEIQKHNIESWGENAKGEKLDGCSEILNFSAPNIIKQIHTSYLQAGANILKANTFGVMPWVLAEYGLEERCKEIAKCGITLAKECIKAHKPLENQKNALFVAASLGPGTKLPSLGHIDYDTMLSGYRTCVEGFKEARADIILLETAQDPLQIKAALHACKEIAPEIPIMVSVTIETTGTMLIGTDITTLFYILEPFEILSLGINCGLGPDLARKHLLDLSAVCKFPISIHTNAGLPQNRGGITYYPMDAEEFSSIEKSFLDIKGVSLLGGCCGTTPEHIKQLVQKTAHHKPLPPKTAVTPCITSLFEHKELKQNPAPLLIGERSNATGSKAFRELLLQEDYEGALSVGNAQVRSGAHCLDLSVAFAGRNEEKDMQALIPLYATKITLPLMADSTQVNALEIALKHIGGRPIINSANLEDGIQKFDKVASLAKKFGAILVCLTIDEQGMCKTYERKIACAKKMMERAKKVHKLREEDIIFDPLTFTIGSGDAEYFTAGIETLNAIKTLSEIFPKAGTTLGLSNISFGLSKEGRICLNSVFLHHAIKNGLTSAIVNVAHIIPYAHLEQADIKACEDLIFNTTQTNDALYAFIKHFESKGEMHLQSTEDDSALSTQERIQKYLINGDLNAMQNLLPTAKDSINPEIIINEILIDAMKIVGERFGNGEMQLPFVLQSAEVMKKSVDYLNAFLPKKQSTHKTTIVIGTVKGDVHDVGKNLVDIILTNNGFNVINIGIKAELEKFLEVLETQKVDCIGMSGLLVKSTLVMKENLQELKRRGITIPIMLGGAALNRNFVEEYCRPNYDGIIFYCKDAFDSVAAMQIIQSGDFSDLTLPSQKAKNENVENKESKKEARLAKKLEKALQKDSTKKPTKCALEFNYITHTPPFFGATSLELSKSDLNSVFDYLDKDLLFKHRWGYSKLKKEEYLELKEKTLEPTFQTLKEEFITQGIFKPIVLYGYFHTRTKVPKNLEDGLILELSANVDFSNTESFLFPRSSKKPYLCLSDYFNPKGDICALHLVSSGHNFSPYEEKLYKNGEYHKYYLAHALGMDLAEALADFIHARVRKELALDSKCGQRYSFGYPACPDLSLSKGLFKLLNPESFGIFLSQTYQMTPEATTSALIVPYKDAKYFAL